MKIFLENSYKNKRLIDQNNENLSCVEIISIRPIKPRLQNETLKTIYYEKFLYVENDLVTIQKEVKKYTKVCKITLGTLISMGIMLVISSLIGYEYPIQTTGYKCLKFETDLYSTATSPTTTTITTTSTTTTTTTVSTTTITTTTTSTSTTTPLCNQGSCATGWTYLRGYCYKNVLFANPGGFEMLTSSLVETKCGPSGSTLAETNEFSSVDYNWLNTCMCKADQPGDGLDPETYFGPILGSATNGKCPVYRCNDNNLSENHICDHGDTLDHHSLFCKYTP